MSQFALTQIVVNHAEKPPRIVVYGDHGIGKTTFATSAPAPIVLRTEDGLAGIQVPTFPNIAQSFNDVLTAIDTLYTETHPFRTFILDSLDWLEPLIWAHTSRQRDKANIEDFGFAAGYKYADVHWRTFLDGCNALRSKDMTVILLSHSAIKRFEAPDTAPYDRYQLKLHQRAANLVSEWADVLGFAHLEVHTVTTGKGFDEATRGRDAGRRLLSVESRAAFEAKNRYSLPPELEFTKADAWQTFANACAPAFSAPAPAPLKLVPDNYSLADELDAAEDEAAIIPA